MMGRLRPGVTRARAQAELAARFHQFALASAANDKERANLPALWLKKAVPVLTRCAASIRNRCLS